jgi:hypothetical protein
MQFLTIMRGNPSASKEKQASLQKAETVEAWEMTKADVMRTLWYIPGNGHPLGTVALLECVDLDEAKRQCQKFPFVVNGIVSLDLIPLSPCTAYELLFAAPTG